MFSQFFTFDITDLVPDLQYLYDNVVIKVSLSLFICIFFKTMNSDETPVGNTIILYIPLLDNDDTLTFIFHHACHKYRIVFILCQTCTMSSHTLRLVLPRWLQILQICGSIITPLTSSSIHWQLSCFALFMIQICHYLDLPSCKRQLA